MKARLGTIALLLCLWTLIYVGIPSLQDLSAASVPPLIAAEVQIPLVPSAVWVYASLYPLLLLAALVSNPADFRRLAGSFAAVTLIAGFVFVFYPTRAAYPQSSIPEGISADLLSAILAIDTRSNLLPSLHVAYGACVLSFLLNWQGHAGWIFSRDFALGVRSLGLLWFVALCLSTVLLHQHHTIDVFGGLLAYAIGSKLSRFLSYGKPTKVRSLV